MDSLWKQIYEEYWLSLDFTKCGLMPLLDDKPTTTEWEQVFGHREIRKSEDVDH